MTPYIKPEKAPSLSKLKATTIEAAHAAGAVLAKNFGKKLVVREKEGAGLVTNIDVAAEKTALRVLSRHYPHFGVLAEESAPLPTIAKSPGRWVMDPLDGTTNYVHAFPMFCVSIAAEWEGEVVVGVIYHPILKDTYVAVKGQGAFLNGKRIRVSKTPVIEEALLTTGFTYGSERWLKREIAAFERLSAVARAVRRPGSAALDLAYTARGVFDGFWERGLSAWDVAAGMLMIREAGGLVTNFKGDPFKIDCKEILTANQLLHPLLQQTIEPDFSPI